MKSFCIHSLFVILVSALLIPSDANAVSLEGEKTFRATVTVDDCRKCHEEVVLVLQRRGKAHTDLCIDCHQGHPPADMEIVPSCNRCHEGKAHFEIDGCLTCHTDPHRPLDILLTKKITEPCLSCHTRQHEELQANPSIHTILECTACHYYHGQIQPCQNCHMPHSDTMGQESCLTCHAAHKPLAVAYGENIVSEDCGSCHEKAYATIAVTWSKHRNVPCVQCHAGKHGMIPACQDCHGVPHPEDIWGKFESCNECHDVAHDLWAFEESTNEFIIEDRLKK